MIIAVTGSSGSIGSELIPFLQREGHSIVSISSSIASNGSSTFSYQDLRSNNINISVDLFIHLASLNSNLTYERTEEEIQLTIDVVKSLKFIQCSKLIFFSTGKVYGDNSFLTNVFDETSHLNPVCSYGKAKKLCENIIREESKHSGLQSIIFRLPPFLSKSDNSNLGKLLKLSAKSSLMPSFFHGELNHRSFISFINIERTMKYILGNLNLAINNKTYNLADDDWISLNNLLRIYSKNKIIVLPRLPSDLIFKIKFLQNTLLKLFGNFVLENSKLKNDMGVKLTPTSKLSIASENE